MDSPLLAGPTPPGWQVDVLATLSSEPGFGDLAKYMVLRCVFRGFGTFRGIKSGPVQQLRHVSSFFLAFCPPGAHFGPKNELQASQKGGQLVRGRFQSGGRGGVNPPQGLGISFA